MLRRTLFAVMAVLAMSATANAGTLYAYMVIDPATTAGAGIAAIPGGGSSMVVSSARSGVGSWHLYAVDDTDLSNGIRSFQVKVNGAVSSLLNRAPTGAWDTETTFGDGVQSNVGLDLNRATVPLITGAQTPGNVVQVAGFGITANNFQAVTSAGSYNGTPTSGQWGNYGDAGTSGVVAATGHTRKALLLAEGLYTGAAPSVDIATSPANNGTIFTSWFSAGFPTSGSFSTASDTVLNNLSNTNPFIPEPATLTLVGLAVVGLGGLVGRRRS